MLRLHETMIRGDIKCRCCVDHIWLDIYFVVVVMIMAICGACARAACM